MTGFKTVLLGLILAIMPTVTQYIGAIDWNTVLPAPWGAIVGMGVSGVLMIVMRYFTTTPVFEKK